MHLAERNATVIPGVETVTIRSDRSFSRHSHDEFGFGYLVNGGQESWSGRGLVEANPGNIITVNPIELHDGIGRKGQPRHWRMLFLSPSVIADLADKPLAQIEFDHPVLAEPAKRNLVEQAISAATGDTPDMREAEERILLALRSTLRADLTERTQTTCSTAMTRIVERIHAEWADPLSLADFAQTAGLSRYQVLRHFAKEVGATPHSYLTQHRVKVARRYISTGMPLAETAVAVGFADQSHLTRAFQRQYGITPGRLLPRLIS